MNGHDLPELLDELSACETYSAWTEREHEETMRLQQDEHGPNCTECDPVPVTDHSQCSIDHPYGMCKNCDDLYSIGHNRGYLAFVDGVRLEDAHNLWMRAFEQIRVEYPPNGVKDAVAHGWARAAALSILKPTSYSYREVPL